MALSEHPSPFSALEGNKEGVRLHPDLEESLSPLPNPHSIKLMSRTISHSSEEA